MGRLDILQADEAGITSLEYQTRTADVMGSILASFANSPDPKTAHVRLATFGQEKIPLRIRVMLDPPSVQVFQYPQGGVDAGKKRVREKLHESGFIEHIPGDDTVIAKPWTNFSLLDAGEFVKVDKTDLTREIIALTVGDPTMQDILGSGLISPEQMAELLELLRLGHQHLMIVVKRHLLGIEREIGLSGPIDDSSRSIKIPYTVATGSDEDTFGFLEKLPEKLAA